MAIIDDNFNGSVLGAHWSEYDLQNDLSVSVGSGLVTLGIASGSTHDLWEDNRDGGAIIQTSGDVACSIEVGVNEIPETSGKSRGIVFFNSDRTEYIRFDQYNSGSTNIFFAYVPFGGTADIEVNQASPSNITNLRLNREDAGGGNWTYFAEYSTNNGTSWSSIGGSLMNTMVLDAVGVSVCNFSSNPFSEFSYSYFYNVLDGIDVSEQTTAVNKNVGIFGANF